LSWCALAEVHHDAALGADALQRALQAIETAIAKARLTGAFLRYCLNDRARIAVSMSRWDLVEETLREILSSTPRPAEVTDIRLEDDFLARVPEGAIDSEVLSRYRGALSAQEKRRARERPAPKK
jgi:hypothetical protein